MPKFKKETEKVKKKKKKKISEDQFAYKSVKVSAVLSAFFLVVSLILNGTEYFFDGIFTQYVANETLWDIVDNVIKSAVIMLFFFFALVSIGNFKELTGKPASMKEMLLLIGLSLSQTIRIFWVFLITMIMLVIVLVYLSLVQSTD